MSPRNSFNQVCRCGAKFFGGKGAMNCPSCGEQFLSTEQQIPPWEKEAHDLEWAREQAEDHLDNRGFDPNREPVIMRALTNYYFSLRKENHVHSEGGGSPPGLE